MRDPIDPTAPRCPGCRGRHYPAWTEQGHRWCNGRPATCRPAIHPTTWAPVPDHLPEEL